MAQLTESVVENAALAWFKALGYSVLHGPDIAAGAPHAERSDPNYRDVILEARLRQALVRLNPKMPHEALDDAYRKLTHVDIPSLIERNRITHNMLVNGVTVEYRESDGSIKGSQVSVIDYDDPDNNDWVVVNQFSVCENNIVRRPDIVVFVNGLPLAVVELKNPGDENATLSAAHQQLTNYQSQIASLFAYNTVLVISDGIEARMGVLGAGMEWFKPWHTISGEGIEPPTQSQMMVLVLGVFDKQHFTNLIRHFIVFENTKSDTVKKVAGYHQFHAVNMAVDQTLRASKLISANKAGENSEGYFTRQLAGGKPGDHRIGVVWHTQGSGKSLTMVFYAGRIILHPKMQNPTIVVITDRNDLDDQLFGVFAACTDLLRQAPVQATDRNDLREKLMVSSGGVVFTTIHKFFTDSLSQNKPISLRHNIVVIADEAHRSQYDFIDGFARYLHDALPNASYIGFTGTPIETADADTRAVFGDYISVYDIQRAVQDRATVPIYYESRLAQVEFDDSAKPTIDSDFDDATEGEEIDRKEKMKSKWAQLEAIVGTDSRIELIAKDIVEHFEQRLSIMDGKAMVVCMSRRIAVELYNAVLSLRPCWQGDGDSQSIVNVVMTGSAADPAEWQQHIRNKQGREELAKRFRNPEDPFKLVIVRDMWLTGFDAPCLHTMYIDKPMRGHGIMQAIARVNRVFKDKPGGLVVDYIGLADELKKALVTYTESGGSGSIVISQDDAVAALKKSYEICCGILHSFDRSAWLSGSEQDRLNLLASAQEYILAQEDGKQRFINAVNGLSRAFALAVPHAETERIRDDVHFMQVTKSVMSKNTASHVRTDVELDQAVKQIVSKAMVSDEVIDIYSAAGIKSPDISILSDEFLSDVRRMPHKNLAVELLNKLLRNDIKARMKHNIVQARSFSEMLEQTIRKYHNRSIETAKIIEELIELAKHMKDADQRGQETGLSSDELAFYDALIANDSAVLQLGDETLKKIACELVQTIRKNAAIDWTLRESVRAQLRVAVKRILRKYKYPPDKQEKATNQVIEQAETLCAEW